jgi:hypothetical protein
MFTRTIFELISKTEHINSKSVLRTIRVVYFSLILGLLSFLAVTFLISQDLKFTFDKNDPIIFANLILFLLAIPVGFSISQTMWKKIEQDLPLKDKIIKYQSGFIIRMATCEGVGMFSIVGFLLSDNLIYLILTAIILLILYSYFPSLDKLELHLDLTQTEIDELK